MSNIHHHDFNPTANELKAVTLDRATQNIQEWCMVIGYDEEGRIIQNSSMGNLAEQLLMIERVRDLIMGRV